MYNVLYVNKPLGITSFDVCFRLRKVLHTRKIGHTGTLDPNAEGVMIILFDKATKANQFLVSLSKEYECRVLFGIATDTLDIDGQILDQQDYVVPEEEKIREVLDSFLGRSLQQVPLTSAISVDGKRLYEYQRQGLEVEAPQREIEVFLIELLEIYEDGFSFSCKVSSGTYIRSLVRDICAKLGLIGTVRDLKRTAIDDIRLDQCDDLEKIEARDYTAHELIELFEKRYPLITYENKADILNGKKIKIDSQAEKVAIVEGREVLAIYEREDEHYRCLRGLW